MLSGQTSVLAPMAAMVIARGSAADPAAAASMPILQRQLHKALVQVLEHAPALAATGYRDAAVITALPMLHAIAAYDRVSWPGCRGAA